MIHITAPEKTTIETYPASSSNEITKEYYNFLVGGINRGTISKVVCSIENKKFKTISYHLLTIK